MNSDTLAGALETTWTRWPERPALLFGEQRMTYAELGDATVALAQAFHSLGVRRGDRVACAISNRPEKIVALGATWLCGAVHVGVDYQFTATELSAMIKLTQPRLLLYEPADEAGDPLPVLQAIQKNHPDVRLVVAGAGAASAGYPTVAELITARPTGGDLPAGPTPEDPALIFISSGTTGKPKATVGYQRNLAQRWQRLAGWLGFGPDDVHLAQMPLAHGFGLMMAMGALLTGGELVLLNRFSAEEALRAIGAEHATVFHGAPAHFKLVLNRLDPSRHNVSSLRLSVGTAAIFPPALVRAIWDQLGVTFMFMYGSSEGVGVATTDREDILRTSVGRPEPGAVQIVGPDRQPLPVGEIGEIAFSRKVYPVRYWGESGSDSLAAALQEGSRSGNEWYYSGDLGRLDDEGRLYVFGRLKHQIDRGGLKVDPVEVEGALLRCVEVADAAVIGLPNPILGETVCACVVPTDEAPSLEQLRAALSGDLATYKLPEELCILDSIPRTTIGKVDLEKLRALVQETARQSARQR